MKSYADRRSFLSASAVGLGSLAFLDRLPAVSAADAKLKPDVVHLNPEIEPLVRTIEETSREKLLEEIAARVKKGLSYRDLLAALLLAGVRNIQPRPVGFKFHAVLVVNSAHLASLAAPDRERWLPIFWALDNFKNSQAQNNLKANPAGGRELIDAGRLLIFLKGTDSHDYKFSSAVMEDYSHLSPEWRDRFLAASLSWLKGSGAKDSPVAKRASAALA
jgi:hypothetical protein